jgi:hypothetical protein
MWTLKDFEGIERLKDYARKHNYVMGDGPKEYTRMPLLRVLLNDLAKADVDEKSLLAGYKGNVACDYIYLRSRIRGHVDLLEKLVLKQAVKDRPDSPIYQALYHRFTDGNQRAAEEILMDETLFPSDRLPDDHLSIFDWGDAPAAVLYLYTVSIMEGA